MLTAPTSQRGWLTFVGSVVALYVGLVLVLSDRGVLEGLLLGTLSGLSIAVAVAMLVVLWRGVPELLYVEKGEL